MNGNLSSLFLESTRGEVDVLPVGIKKYLAEQSLKPVVHSLMPDDTGAKINAFNSINVHWPFG